MEIIAFKEWIGSTHLFYGVDNGLFKLEECVFEPDTDYEGMRMTQILKHEDKSLPKCIFSSLPLALVCVEYNDGENPLDPDEYYRLRDVADNHIWLRFGTNYRQDSYYPFFFFEYNPKNTEGKQMEITTEDAAKTLVREILQRTLMLLVEVKDDAIDTETIIDTYSGEFAKELCWLGDKSRDEILLVLYRHTNNKDILKMLSKERLVEMIFEKEV